MRANILCKMLPRNEPFGFQTRKEHKMNELTLFVLGIIMIIMQVKEILVEESNVQPVNSPVTVSSDVMIVKY